MLKMMILMLGMMLPLASTPIETNNEKFINEVDEKYSYYILNEYTNEYYSLIIAQGIYNAKATYGICFTSKDPGKYNLLIEEDGILYSLPVDDRKDSMAIAIKSLYTMKIHIYDRSGNEQSFTGKKVLDTFTMTSFPTTDPSVVPGNGKGGAFDELTVYTLDIPFALTFIIVLSSVIVISVATMLIMFIFKLGFFNKSKRQEGTLNIKQLLSEETYDIGRKPLFEDIDAQEVVIQDEKTQALETNNAETSEVITTVTNVKEYLQNLGYSTDYPSLGEDEKNKIMLELMKLKTEKRIEIKDYYEETYQLWKK